MASCRPINEVLLQAGYDVIAISPPGAASRDFSWCILKERPRLPDSNPSNYYLRIMLSEITRLYCQRQKVMPNMTSSLVLRQGSLHALLNEGIWKSYHDFLIAFHSNFLSGIHGLWDNEVLLQIGYDVIVIVFPRERFTQVLLTESERGLSFIIMVHRHILLISNRFGVIRHFIFADNCPFRHRCQYYF